MSALNLDELLQAIDEAAPSGVNHEYEHAFLEMSRSARGSEGQDITGEATGVEAANWREVEAQAMDLVSKTHDLRVGIHLLAARTANSGYDTVGDSMALLRGYLEQRWATVHPQLDEDDDDPTERINAMSMLCDQQLVLDQIRKVPIVELPGFGKFCYRDLLVAKGEALADEGTSAPDESLVLAAFSNAPEEVRLKSQEATRLALAELKTIDSIFDRELGAGLGPNLSIVQKLFGDIDALFGSGGAGETELEQSEEATEGVQVLEQGDGGHPQNSVVATAVGPGRYDPIRSSEEAGRFIDMVCDYYRFNEPSSPVPVLLQRARKLMSLDFMGIIENLVPDGLHQIESIRGPGEEEE